jgi:DNA-binding GntR family transcriptional regulator
MNSVKARDADAVAKACLHHIRQAGQAGLDALPPDDPSTA